MNPTVPTEVLDEAQTVVITRGSTPVWDTGAPELAHGPPVVLLHGWNIDAPTNFGFAVPELARSRRVVMFDHHGHGHGPRSNDKFTLEAAAHDVVEVLDELDIPRAVIAGYSMGGAIAQLVAHHHPERCDGVVLMATAGVFCEARRERLAFSVCGAGAQAMSALPDRITNRLFQTLSALGCRDYPAWVLDKVRAANPVSLLEAGAALGRFDSLGWVSNIEPPVAALITANDSVVPAHRQVNLAATANAVHVETVVADHDLPIRNDRRFSTAIERALDAVDPVLSRNDHQLQLAH